MSELARAKLLVHGIVQSVGFRYYCTRLVPQYGLTGYVKNRFDGAVELEVEGERGMISDFIEELKVGPSHASITRIDVEWAEYQGLYSDFSVKF